MSDLVDEFIDNLQAYIKTEPSVEEVIVFCEIERKKTKNFSITDVILAFTKGLELCPLIKLNHKIKEILNDPTTTVTQ